MFNKKIKLMKTKLEKFQNRILAILVVSFFSITIFNSCDHSYLDITEDEIDDFVYEPIFALPLINSTITVDHFINIEDDPGIYADEESLVVFVYRDSIRITSLDAGNNYADGYLGLGIFDDEGLTNMFFLEPYLDVFANNSFQTPVDIQFNWFDFHNRCLGSNDFGEERALGGQKFDDNNPWMINTPAPGQFVMNEIRFTRDNANLDEVLAIHPTEVEFQIQAIERPDGDKNNKTKDNGQLDVDVELHLPLRGSLELYELRDTIEFDFDDVEEGFDYIEWIELKLRMDNGFPVDLISLKLQFMNEDMDEVLFEQVYDEIFESAKVDENGDVVESTLRETLFFIDRDEVDKVQGAKNILLSLTANTEDHATAKSKGDPFTVSIYDYYTIDIQMGMRVKLGYRHEFGGNDNDE